MDYYALIARFFVFSSADIEFIPIYEIDVLNRENAALHYPLSINLLSDPKKSRNAFNCECIYQQEVLLQTCQRWVVSFSTGTLC